jgi:hypothetical protein
MRVLVTDALFPNALARWRLVEIHSFVEKYDTDILVFHDRSYGSHVFTIDWEVLYEQFHLERYDIIIYNESFSFLNKYNTEFEGNVDKGNTMRQTGASYMLRLKKYRHIKNNSFAQYTWIHHIFLRNYFIFKHYWSFPEQRQSIHLYPGGGYSHHKQFVLPCHVFYTQHFLKSNITTDFGYALYLGPFFFRNEYPASRSFMHRPLTVCTAAMGEYKRKGIYQFFALYDRIVHYDLDHLFRFVTFGTIPDHEGVINAGLKTQSSLDLIYREEVDVYINLGTSGDGFPLGVEAVIQGCVLLTTDPYNSNERNGFFFDPFFLIQDESLDPIIHKLQQLTEPLFRQQKSELLQRRLYELTNYETQMQPIFETIERTLEKENVVES